MTRIDPNGARGFLDPALDALQAGVARLLESRPAERIDRDWPDLRPGELQAMLADRTLSVEARAKLVQVALLRGGRSPRAGRAEALKLREAQLDVILHQRDGKLAYQRLAVAAVLAEPPLFEALSRDPSPLGPDAIHPATRWMEAAAQPYGWLEAEEAGRWMTGLPAELRGRAWYHLLDAANEADKGVVRVTGGKVSAGAVSLEIDYHPRDSDWKNQVQRVGTLVDRDLDGRSGPHERAAFRRGVDLADWTLR